MDALAAELGFMAADERDDIVREFDSHLRDAGEARPDLSEEELIDRLPPPASIAATYSAELPAGWRKKPCSGIRHAQEKRAS
jgi:uncharacterized membrane protein